ncbi:MAG: LTA synthase family protein [Rikenellaceae bacterium]
MLQRFKYLIITYCATVALLAAQRILFLAVYFDSARKFPIVEILKSFYYGLTLDVSVAGYIMMLPLLVLVLSVWIPLGERFWRGVMLTFLTLIAVVSSLILAGDLGLYEYWNFRVDSSVLFYLASPKAAAASVVMRDVLVSGVTFAVMVSAMFASYRWCVHRLSTPRLKWWQSVLSTLGLLLCGGVMFVGIRGGVSVSVANLSKVYFSHEEFLNHAAVNPQFSLLSTIGEEDDFVGKYQFFWAEELAQNVATCMPQIEGGEVTPLLTTERPNILFIIGESFSGSIINLEIEGEEVMPNLRRLAAEGVYFPNAIANSFRTDRGVTSTLYGFPAQPRTSIMKYPIKSRKLPSLAAELASEGYATEFIYGGDLNFTDMASMLYSTGWRNLKWQQNIKTKVKTNSKWGFDDLFMSDFVIQSVVDASAAGTPFITGWLTLSSHEPFEVPYDKFEDKVLNSMAFADDAVGRVVDSLRNTSAWDNLLVIIVADHAYSSYPKGLKYNSLLRHRIPLIWCGGAVAESMVVDKYVAQMDIVATLLSQMGLNHDKFEFSRDMMNSNFRERGYYAFSDGFGVVDSKGSIIYDNSAGRIISHEGDTTHLEILGKTTLQQTMKVLEEY